MSILARKPLAALIAIVGALWLAGVTWPPTNGGANGSAQAVAAVESDVAGYGLPKGCTILSMAVGDAVFFAANEDYSNPDTVIGFSPTLSGKHGHIDLGYRNDNGSVSWQFGMNDQGLVWDGNSLPALPLNNHPERPYSGFFHYLDVVLSELGSVSDAVELIGQYDFSHLGGSMNFQIHLADASGDAVVIAPGSDGELTFVGKDGAPYLVSTNFNLALSAPGTNSETYHRYDKAIEMLELIEPSTTLVPGDLVAILDATHVEGLDTFTLYSVVADLQNRILYLSHMSEFDEVIRIDMTEELGNGERVQSIEDLFSVHTTNGADSKRLTVAVRDILLRFIALGSIILSVGLLVAAAWRGKTRSDEARRRRKWVLLALLGLAVANAFESIVMIVWHGYPAAIVASMHPAELRILALVSSIPATLGLALAVVARVILSKTEMAQQGWWKLSPLLVVVGVPAAVLAAYLGFSVAYLFTVLY